MYRTSWKHGEFEFAIIPSLPDKVMGALVSTKAQLVVTKRTLGRDCGWVVGGGHSTNNETEDRPFQKGKSSILLFGLFDLPLLRDPRSDYRTRASIFRTENNYCNEKVII